MRKLAVTTWLSSVSGAAEQFGVRALLRLWQRATSAPEHTYSVYV